VNNCNTSSNDFNYTPFKHTSDEIKWVGESVECLNVCRGSSITVLEQAILNKLCILVGETNMSSVDIPSCFITAWINKDKTILSLFEFLLDLACAQQTTIDGLPTTNNPVITLDYKCCEDNPCIQTVAVTVSTHLQQILDCICALNARVVELESQVSTFATQSSVTALSQQIQCLKTSINLWNQSTDNPITINC